MKTRIARWLSLATYAGLVAWTMAWIVFLGGVAREHISLSLLLFVTPLLLPLRGVLAGRDKALIWGALVSLAYFVYGGMLAWTEGPHRALGLVEAVLALVYLVSASLFIRWRAEARTDP